MVISSPGVVDVRDVAAPHPSHPRVLACGSLCRQRPGRVSWSRKASGERQVPQVRGVRPPALSADGQSSGVVVNMKTESSRCSLQCPRRLKEVRQHSQHGHSRARIRGLRHQYAFCTMTAHYGYNNGEMTELYPHPNRHQLPVSRREQAMPLRARVPATTHAG
ncbi:hypothetical protein BD413DRAFT_560931 [Trametes elegans]|nr:hypothetical protein BD413DRAFT_560931 [Trametes elegans]